MLSIWSRPQCVKQIIPGVISVCTIPSLSILVQAPHLYTRHIQVATGLPYQVGGPDLDKHIKAGGTVIMHAAPANGRICYNHILHSY